MYIILVFFTTNYKKDQILPTSLNNWTDCQAKLLIFWFSWFWSLLWLYPIQIKIISGNHFASTSSGIILWWIYNFSLFHEYVSETSEIHAWKIWHFKLVLFYWCKKSDFSYSLIYIINICFLFNDNKRTICLWLL